MKKEDWFVVSYVINMCLIFLSIIFMIVGLKQQIGQIIICFSLAMILITIVLETDS
jgi:uncharacterized membrane protein YwaF